jgi:hypothetical protein
MVLDVWKHKNGQEIKAGYAVGLFTAIGQPFIVRAIDSSSPRERRALVVCQCACGEIRVIRCGSLATGGSLSCGRCIHVVHGVGYAKPPLYRTWGAMRNRCNNPTNRAYQDYGGRGIYVCSEWDQYQPFADWAKANGYRSGLSIDRIDNDGPYAPWNCRWATQKQQTRNKRTTLWAVAFGERKSAADWAEDPRCAVECSTLRKRICSGWQHELAISTPPTK